MKIPFLWRNVLTLNTLTFLKHFHMGIAKLIVTNMASHLFEKYVQSQPKNSAYNINISSISFNSNSKGQFTICNLLVWQLCQHNELKNEFSLHVLTYFQWVVINYKLNYLCKCIFIPAFLLHVKFFVLKGNWFILLHFSPYNSTHTYKWFQFQKCP